MKTIEHFNEIVNVWQTPPGSPVVVGVGDGRESIRSLSEEPGRGIEAFRDMIGYGVYQHVALIDSGRVMAIWHAQSVTVPAQAAGYTYPELLDKYFPGEPEEMKQPSITDASPGYSEPAEPGSDAKDEYTRDEEQARLLARIRELEEAIEQIRTDANDALGEWSPVGFTHIPENLEPYWFIRRAAEKALGEDYVTKALAEAQEERG